MRRGEGSGPLELGDNVEGAYLSLKSSAASLALSISRITRELSMAAARICRIQGAGVKRAPPSPLLLSLPCTSCGTPH